jgi:hypothetical protein
MPAFLSHRKTTPATPAVSMQNQQTAIQQDAIVLGEPAPESTSRSGNSFENPVENTADATLIPAPAVARLQTSADDANGKGRRGYKGPAVLGKEDTKRRRLESPPSAWRTPGLKLRMHRSTTSHLASLYPCHANAGLGAKGIYMGIDHEAGGSSFHYDPFELYKQGVLTSPNMLILGLVGSGKSTVVKTLLYRMLGVLGSPGGLNRFALICDPKGEYDVLAKHLGLTSLYLKPGGSVRINPLDPGPVRGDVRDLSMRRTQMVTALAAGVMDCALQQIEDAGVSWAIDALTPTWEARPTLNDVVNLLAAPTGEMVARSGMREEDLVTDLRNVRLGLSKLLDRDMRGMFDGQSTEKIDWTGRGVVIDLSAVNNTPAQPLVIIAATGWFQQMLAAKESEHVPRRVQVMEEIWALLANPQVARYYQASQKLARTYGVANIAVAHRLEDLTAQSDDGSAAAKQGAGLAADTQTQVLFHLPPKQAAEAQELFGLSNRERDILTGLGKGQALWRVADHTSVVTHQRSDIEIEICDTDSNMITAE